MLTNYTNAPWQGRIIGGCSRDLQARGRSRRQEQERVLLSVVFGDLCSRHLTNDPQSTRINTNKNRIDKRERLTSLCCSCSCCDYSTALQCYILTDARQAAYIALQIASHLCRTHQLVSSPQGSTSRTIAKRARNEHCCIA